MLKKCLPFSNLCVCILSIKFTFIIIKVSYCDKKKRAPIDCEMRFNFEDAVCVRKYAMFRL